VIIDDVPVPLATALPQLVPLLLTNTWYPRA
jgi:hypothetical protein